MCNKRTFIIKHNFIKRTAGFLAIVVHVLMITFTDGWSQNASTNQFNAADLYNAIEQRDFHALWEFKDHQDASISSMALRAMIHANNIPLDTLFEATIASDNPALWRVLSHQSLPENQLEVLNNELTRRNVLLGGLCEVIARQGDEESLRALSENGDLLWSEESCSFAAGYLLAAVPSPEGVTEKLFSDLLNKVITESIEHTGDRGSLLKTGGDDRVALEETLASGENTVSAKNRDHMVRNDAFRHGNSALTNLLYGLYRTELNRPASGNQLFSQLEELLEQQSGEFTLIDEYLARIISPNSINIILNNRNKELLYNDVQVSIELASAVAHLDVDQLDPEAVRLLAGHPSPHVQVELLESLAMIGEQSQPIVDLISDQREVFNGNPETSLAYLRFMKNNGQELSSGRDKTEHVMVANPYLADQVFDLLSEMPEQQSHFERLTGYLNEEGILALHASTALSRFVQETELDREQISVLRRQLMNAVESGNRSVISGGREIYLDERFITESDLKKIIEIYNEIVSPPDTGLASAIYSILSETSYAMRIAEPVHAAFRRPDAFKPNELNPVWVLETEHGVIEIELDAKAAPYTVSSIIHLTEMGRYDDVVLHRIVRNFVVQGGDFDREDGFGGPDYRIPTEPGTHTFYKGSVGIASSGTDTEGSQFFITLTPTPHLDGNYTIFGNVRSGMSVVESIQKGDRVLRAVIQ